MEFIQELFSGSNGMIEIREIGDSIKREFIKPNDFESYVLPYDKNVYFGTFARKDSTNGTSNNCLDSKVVWCDIDNFTKGMSVPERVAEAKLRVQSVGLPKASVIVSSGNGVHLYWLLNKRASKGIVELNRALAMALGGDIRATDKARILRLPNSFNVKDTSNPLRCEEIESDYSNKYPIVEFYEVLGDSIPKEKKEPLRVNEAIPQIEGTPPCIAKMLKGVPAGDRNFALGRIVKWLQQEGHTKAQTKEIVQAWNEKNDPPEEVSKVIRDFWQYWQGDYKLLGCSIKNIELQSILGKYCDKSKCAIASKTGKINLNNSIQYNNRLLSDMPKLTGNDLIIYGVLVRHSEGLFSSMLTEKITSIGTKKPCMSEKTMRDCLGTLEKKRFIEKITGIQRRGIENFYKAIPQGTYGLGYTVVSNGAINGTIDKRVTSAQFKLYVLLLKYTYNKGNCYPSLDTLAKELRTTRVNISTLLKQLERADYIKRYYVYPNGIRSLDMHLLVWLRGIKWPNCKDWYSYQR